MTPNRSQKRKGNPKPKPPTRKKNNSKKPPVEQILLPKYLEHFCWAIFEGKSARIAAAEIGRKPNSGFYLRHHPSVQFHLAEIQKQYRDKLVEIKANARALTVDFLDEQIIDIAANGENGDGTGRNVAAITGYKSLMLIDAPSPQTIVALQMAGNQQGLGGSEAPKVYDIRGPRKYAQLIEGTPVEGSQT